MERIIFFDGLCDICGDYVNKQLIRICEENIVKIFNKEKEGIRKEEIAKPK